VAQVRHALAEGWSWSRIAAALGVSKQAAHKKHGAPRASEARAGGEEGKRMVITGQAREVVELAREAAQGLGDENVEPEHLLLGLLRSGDGPAWAALRRAGVRFEAVRQELSAARTKQADTDEHALPRGRPAISPAARSSFEQSLREAVARNDDHLGAEHLLLALICDRDGAPAQTIGRLGIPLGRLHRQLERAIGTRADARDRIEAPHGC
jgi:ATP-dependent Clp protease ATP-binding subunit ClpA